MSRPPLSRYTQLPASVQHSWDAWPVVDAALQELEVGQFGTPALLADALLADDRVAGVLATRINGLLGLPLEFVAQGDDAGEEPSNKFSRVSGLAKAALPEMLPEHALGSMLRWGILHGVSVGELTWKRRGDLWMPTLRVWHNQWLYWVWDAARAPEKQLWLITASGPVNVTPGDGHWVVHTPFGNYFGWLQGLIRPLAKLWLDRQFVFRDWARRSERNGLGITIGRVPQNADDASKKTFRTGLMNLASESTIIAPTIDEKNRFDVEMLDTREQQGTTGFAEHVKQLDTSIAVCVLGQNLTTEVKGGSKAAAQVHENVRRDFLRADAAALSATLYRQVFLPWARINWGDEALAPVPRWNVEPPDDRKETATALAQLATALQAFQEAGAPVDVRALLDEQGVPLTDEEAAKPGDQAVLRLLRMNGPSGPHVRGRLYADNLADHAKGAGAAAVEPDSETLLRLIGEAKDFPDLRERLGSAFGELGPDRLAELTEKALLMAELAGRHGLLEGV